MKAIAAKRTLVLAAVGTCLALVLASCSGSDANRDDSWLSERLDALEQHILDLEKRLEEAGRDIGENMAESQESTAEAEAASQEELAALLDDLKIRIDEAVAEADAVSVPDGADADDLQRAYYDAVRPLKDLEREMDKAEDKLEASFRDDTITRDAVRELERTKEQLEDALDQAKDSLEQRFGID